MSPCDDMLAEIVTEIKRNHYLITLDQIVTMFYSSSHFDSIELVASDHYCRHVFLLKHAEKVVNRYPIIADTKIRISDRSIRILDDFLIKYSFLTI